MTERVLARDALIKAGWPESEAEAMTFPGETLEQFADRAEWVADITPGSPSAFLANLRRTAHPPPRTSGAYGLWQMMPSEGFVPGSFDPGANARAAFARYQRGCDEG